jgi:hypothetical protein
MTVPWWLIPHLILFAAAFLAGRWFGVMAERERLLREHDAKLSEILNNVRSYERRNRDTPPPVYPEPRDLRFDAPHAGKNP